MSRASIGPGYGPGGMGPDPNMHNILKDRFTNINTAKSTIEKQREFDAAYARLQKDFEILDKNGDGLVSLEELQVFLSAKVIRTQFNSNFDKEQRRSVR